MRFDQQRTAHLITFLRRTGLGFRRDLCDAVITEASDTDAIESDLDIGPVGLEALSLDLDI